MLTAVFSAKALVYTAVVPEGTKACFIAGSMTDWSQVQMDQDADEPTIFTIDIPDATVADGYKYCCGPGWAYVEKNAEGGEISDRAYPDDGMNIDFVETWAMEWDPDAVEKDYTLNVTVPEGTFAVYVNGSFNNWSGFERLEKVTETTFTLTVTVAADEVQYKYSSGPSWDYEELQEDGSALPSNRSLTEPESDDVVELWKEIYEPPSGGITLNVTVPEGTFAVYVAGSMNEWKHQLMERVTETTYTITFSDEELDEIEYKYCSGPGWDYEELQEDGSGVSNRTLSIIDSPSDDVVALWKEVFEPEFTLNVTVPEGTNACYVAGSMNGWTQQEMEKVDETTYTITFSAGSAVIEYKYCSGPGWDYEELKEDGTGMGNRKLTVSDSPSDDVVALWKEVYETGIQSVVIDDVIVIGDRTALTVQFTGNATIELYTIQGALLNKTVATGIYNRAGLPAGIYVVKVNNKAYKALVK